MTTEIRVFSIVDGKPKLIYFQQFAGQIEVRTTVTED